MKKKFAVPNPLSALRALLFAIVLIAAGTHAAHAAPVAGTTIGNQASASYTDASSISRTATSNTVTTIVTQVGAFTLAANGSKLANPGQTVYYPHTITNTGNGSDSFVISAANAGGDDFNYTALYIYLDANGDGTPDNFTDLNGATVGPVAPGATYKFIVAGVVPGSATSAQTGLITVTADNTFDTYANQTNTDTTTVTNQAVINVTKSISVASGPAGTTGITYTLTYTNTGNAAASNVIIKDAIPTGMTYVAGSGRWSITGAGTTLTDLDETDSQGTAPNSIIYDYNVTEAGKITAVINQLLATQSGNLTFQVNVNSTAAPGTIPNTGSFTFDPNGDGTHTDQTASQNTNTVNFTVTQSASVVANGSSTNSVDGTSEPVVVASANQIDTISFNNYIWNTGNASDSFDITYSGSSFPAGTNIQLFKSDGLTPLVDTNGNGTADTGPIPVPAGGVCPGGYVINSAAGDPNQNKYCGYLVVVKAVINTTVSGGGPYEVTITATSKFDGTKSNTVIDRLTTIAASSVDLTNNAVSGDAACDAAGDSCGFGAGGANGEAAAQVTNSVNPNVTTVFKLYVKNTGPVADTYDLTYSKDSPYAAGTMHASWTVTFKEDSSAGACTAYGATITNTGLVASAGNKLVCALVTVPAGAVAGDYAVYFKVLSATTGAYDVKHDQVTVNAVRSLTLTPNNTGQIFPGGSVVFTHTIQNTGNVTEGTVDTAGAPDGSTDSKVTLALASSLAGWTSQLYWDKNNDGALDAGDPIISDLQDLTGGSGGASTAAGLDAGESARLFVKVTAPAGASVGDSNLSTLTATITGTIRTVVAPAAVVATDTANVIAGQVRLEKKQAIDVACDGTADAAYSIANLNAKPGECIRYEITATNAGTTAVTNLIVSDATPANTTYSAAVEAATTVGSITAKPAGGATGSVTANVGGLAPGASAVITFGVKVDN